MVSSIPYLIIVSLSVYAFYLFVATVSDRISLSGSFYPASIQDAVFPQCTNQDCPLILMNIFLTCILNSIMEPLRCNTGIRSVCPCQILLDGFVQTNKRPCPCVSLVFSRGIGHLLSGVYQGQ